MGFGPSQGSGAPPGAGYVTTGSETGLSSEAPISTVIARGTFAARPTAGTAGYLYHATDYNIIYRDNGSTWDAWAVAVAGSAQGDTIYFDGTKWQRLAKGSDDQVYTLASGVPSWAAAFSSPLTTKGDIFVYSSADARLAVGSNDQVLTADSGEALGVKWAASGSGVGDVGCKCLGKIETIAAGVPEILDFDDTDIKDTHAFHDPASNPSRITIPVGQAGTYAIGLSVWWENTAAACTYVTARIKKNGGNRISIDAHEATAVATDDDGHAHVMIDDCAEGDYYEVQVAVGGAAANIQVFEDASPIFWCQRIA